ncbi:hypothetical protein B296_00016792 [Ensete ventricosum]|uniref:Protein kinase domain-containing protein n=1 Tax=Ensete ventricosum TaxID=4639 RepID=A0A426ZSC0_ENSVE|nr:hypothetical protein B296_00016792 [Ensete ventricosum]
MIQHRPYNQKVDVYSFGIVLWELITGMLPFQNMSAVQAAFAVMNKAARPIHARLCRKVASLYLAAAECLLTERSVVLREMIQHKPYNQKVDVYSFGIVLWELITGMLPFQNMSAVQAAFAVVNKAARPVVPQGCLPALGEIMTRCWDADPDVRPSFYEIVRMLESAQEEIVRKARFRCCMRPMTVEPRRVASR